MARRGAGEGSIFRDKSTGRWRALLDVGEDAAGRRRRRKVSGRTRAEVAAKLRDLQRDLEDGLSSAGRHVTVALLSEDWLRHRSGELSASTLEVRTWAVRQHIAPALGARRVRELTADDVARFLQDLAGAGYARATLDKVRGVLVQVLRHAERQGLIVRNVAAIVPTPPGPRAGGRSLTVEQATALLTAARGHPLEAAIVLALTCGLRPGELLGLHWDDVDLDRKLLRVRRAVVRIGGSVQLGPTKTASSRRQLRLPGSTADALRRHRDQQDRRRWEMGEAWHDEGLVFSTGVGTLLDPANLRRGLRQVTEKAGLGRWHPHELRHSAASLLSAAGVPLEEVADVLGHASTRVTSQTYRHATTPTVEAGAEPMERLFGRSGPGHSVTPVATSLATSGDEKILRGSGHPL
jgi:integrase